ncbi:hypothetical protein [Longispora albida]|uniref:hypothetical protein n=1 Tax=Longispora albida TaxID=203523 RepID=UPI00036E4298|nr:hypothetical protein [Longispora albida]
MTELDFLVLTAAERAQGASLSSVTFSMDWTGEEYPGQLAAFAASRVRATGAQPADDVFALPEAPDDPAPGRGDYPVRQLDHLAGALETLGCTLLLHDTGTDTYELLIALTSGDDLTGLAHEGSPVRAWGSDTGITLVSLDCPGCSDMLVWELPSAETLAGERCSCGAALFDTDGSPMPGVVLHD